MPLDPEVLASINLSPSPAARSDASGAGTLDADVIASLKRTDEAIESRRQYLRDRYAWGLVAPLSGSRLVYAKQAAKEVADPEERQWLVEEVARIAKMQEAMQRQRYGEKGFTGRFWENLQKVGGSFANAGTGMVEAATNLRDSLQGRGRSPDDVRFIRALESAKESENPYVRRDAGFSGKAATGAAAMAPDMAAGLLANAAGGPPAMVGYWTARLQPERREDYLEMGVSPGAAALAGTATAGLEGAVELLNIDPTGLTKPVAAPVKGAIRRGLTKAAEKVGGQALKSFAKNPVTRRAVGAGIDTFKRTGLETVEEGLQGAVQEGGKYLAAKSSDQIEDRSAADVVYEGIGQAKEALPGLAVLGGVGGAVQAGGAAGRYKRFMEGSKQARMQNEIIQAAQDDRAPSRAKWAAWGLPADKGRNRKERREAVKQLAAEYQTLEQLRTVVSGVTPTEEQWKRWGFPPEEGKTEAQRRAYLAGQVEPPAPAEAAEAGTAPLEPPKDEASETPESPRGPIEIRGDEFGDGHPAQIRKMAVQWARENLLYTKENQRKFLNKETGRQIAVTGTGIQHTTKMGKSRQVLASIRKIPELIEAAHFVRSEQDRKNRPGVRSGDVFEAPAMIGSEEYVATLYVTRMAEGLELEDIYYHHKVSKKGLARPKALDSEESGPVPDSESLNNNTTTRGENVKQDGERPEDTTSSLEAVQAQGQSPRRHDYSVDMDGTGERIGGREVVRQIEQIWGVPIRLGRMGRHSKARGIFKMKAVVSRLAKGEEASPAVAIHEAIGHHLDSTTDVLKRAPKAVRAEVAQLDYDVTAARDFEGFAEFVRAYLTGSTERLATVDLSQTTPTFLAYFEQWLDKHPDIRVKLEATRKPLDRLRRAGAVGRVKGQVSKDGVDRSEELKRPLPERLNDLKEFLYTRIKEEGRPVKRFTDEAIKQGYDPGDDATPFEAYNALRQIGPHFAANAIENGIFRLTGNMGKIGPSLREVLEEIEEGEDYENFIAWAYARHAIESWSKLKNPGITLEDAKEVYQRLRDSRYERAADKLTEFNNDLITVLVDVGAIDDETAIKILSEYKYYIPLERAKEGAALGHGGRRLVDLSAAIKGRRGSGLQIIDPLESTLSRAIRLYERAAKQVVINKLVKVAEDIKGLGGWVEAVPTKVMATNFAFDEIRPQIAKAIEDELGIDPDDILSAIDPMMAITIWRPDLMKVHGEPIVRVTRNGKPAFFYLHKELAEALGGLETLQHLDFVTQIAKSCTGALKLGATRLNPDFILANAARDMQTFLMQGEKGLKGAFDPAKYATVYIASEFRAAVGKDGDRLVELFKRMGGELSTYAGLDRNRLRKGVRRTLQGKQDKISTALNIAGVTEVAPRLAEFAAILDKEGWLNKIKRGYTPPMDVLIRAISAAHDVTIDFRRLGTWGRYINYYIPFFNARLEGLDKTVRTFKDKPAETSLRVAMQIVPLAFIYWWYRHDDDDYKERPEWQDGFYVLKDSEGNPTYRIPKSQEWGLLESGVERLLDVMYEKDPAAVSRWFGQAMKTINPVATPSGVTPAFEAAFNYDSFRGRPIVSTQLQKLQAPDQYYEYTSNLAKGVARLLHDASGGKISLSPAKIDHLANGFSGALYQKITSPIEKIIEGDSWALNDVPGLKGLTLRKDYAKSVDDFYQEKERLDQAHESANLHGRDDKDRAKWSNFESVSSLMTDMRKAARGLSAEDRTKTEMALIGLARAALGREALERYPNPLANLDVLPPAVREVAANHIARRAATASKEHGDDKTGSAAAYLRDLGVDENVAQHALYARLRAQGVKSNTARERAARLKTRL